MLYNWEHQEAWFLFFFAFHKLILLNYDGIQESFKGEYIDKINLCMRQTSQI